MCAVQPTLLKWSLPSWTLTQEFNAQKAPMAESVCLRGQNPRTEQQPSWPQNVLEFQNHPTNLQPTYQTHQINVPTPSANPTSTPPNRHKSMKIKPGKRPKPWTPGFLMERSKAIKGYNNRYKKNSKPPTRRNSRKSNLATLPRIGT